MTPMHDTYEQNCFTHTRTNRLGRFGHPKSKLFLWDLSASIKTAHPEAEAHYILHHTDAE